MPTNVLESGSVESVDADFDLDVRIEVGAGADLPEAGQGCTVWLTGLPSAGKSTIARHLAGDLADKGYCVEILDGDQLRDELGALPFDKAGRDLNVARIGWVAALLARNGVKVVVASIAPYEMARRAVRERHEVAGIPFIEAYVAAPLEVCADRDVKGLYARQRAGLMSGLTGVDDPYEPPAGAEIVLRTDQEDSARSAAKVMSYLAEHKLL
jgi:adenylylsulfate kinase